MKKLSVVIGCSLLLILLGCASGNKTDLGEEIDPVPAIAEAVKLMDQAEKQQADLLSIKEYTRATQNLEKAQQGLAGGYQEKYILEKAELAKTNFLQAHTDSMGPDDLSSKLSNDRAVSVAQYLASLKGGYKIRYIGYGESRPIGSNETKEGRAINRRVDLEVTARKTNG